MKKLLLLFVLLSIVFQPCIAAVQQTTVASELQAEYLQEAFDGFEITFQNNGKNPIKIISIDCPQFRNNARQVILQKALQINKKNNKYYYMSVFTLGVTGFVANAKNGTNIDKENAALAESANFATDLNAYKGEVIPASSSKTIKILVPKGETPNVSSVFQDTKTNECIGLTK